MLSIAHEQNCKLNGYWHLSGNSAWNSWILRLVHTYTVCTDERKLPVERHEFSKEYVIIASQASIIRWPQTSAHCAHRISRGLHESEINLSHHQAFRKFRNFSEGRTDVAQISTYGQRGKKNQDHFLTPISYDPFSVVIRVAVIVKNLYRGISEDGRKGDLLRRLWQHKWILTSPLTA